MDSRSRADELIARFVEGIATTHELTELQRRIVQDPSVADAYAHATRFEGMLTEFFSNDRSARETRQVFEDAYDIVAGAMKEVDSLNVLASKRQRRSISHPLSFTSVAVIALLLVATLTLAVHFNLFPLNRAAPLARVHQHLPGGADDGPAGVEGVQLFGTIPESNEIAVAVVTQLIGARFSRVGFSPVVGDQFRTGLYRLTNGILELTFAHSPEIILEAPCEFDLKGRELMLLHRGKVSAKVPKGAGDFTIETPSATVMDKGTEFAVQVDDKDDSEVHVFDGMVSVTPRSGDTLNPAILYSESASAIGKRSATPCGIDVDRDRFLRNLSEPESKYARLIIEWDPVLYYRMIPAGGIIHDAGPIGIPASIVRGESEGTPWTVGRIGSALQFGGPSVKDYAVVPDYPKTTNGTLSVVAWVFAKSRPRSATIVKNWAGDEHGQFHFGLHHDDGQIEISVSDGEGREVTAQEKSPFPIGKWQHVAFVADGTRLRLYRNGVEVSSAPYSGIGGDPKLKALGIGVKLNAEGSQPDILRLNDDDPGISDYWHGRIDELAVFNHPLSPEQVRQLFDGTE
jgi:hypothetical protein